MSNDRKFPTEWIDLPSQGWYYDPESPLASGKIELKYLTAREEDILTSRNLIQKGIVLDELMKSLIVDKSIDYSELLTGDKNGIMIASRILGYGKDYPISYTCSSCGLKQEMSLDLTKLEEKKLKEPKEKGVNKFEFKLPVSKKIITFRLLTHKDEADLTIELDNLESAGLTGGVDKTLSTRLKYILVAVDGNADKKAVRDFVDDAFLARDARAFREYYASVNPDVDLFTDFACNRCGDQRRISVPIGIDFFWPDAGV